jgi:hypothetical protein
MAAERPKRRKPSPTEELFKQVLSKLTGQDTRLSSIEQQLVLTQNELVRHGRLIEEVNNRCIEKLGLQCAALPQGDEDDEP